ncbi:MAG TPA: glycoside hydrolase family 38 C-terminal domain-containing protein [Bacteroidota bacterium]|nr:glycoside hydrolase family 38 C-terminal domain-containing protein [Bacteroidota bacterium]
MKPTRIVLMLLMVLPASRSVQAQEHTEPPINIRITGASGHASQHYLNGFASEMYGQTISYHSSHPAVEDALICRVNREADSIAWRTDTVTAPASGGYLRFVWLAGIEHIGWGNATHPHKFEFSVNGRHWFSFTNRKDSTAPMWTEHGPDGADLTFESHYTDKFGDLFGLMYLSLPEKDFPRSIPLVLSVKGVNADSPEWFMVFKYRFSFLPSVRVEPALIRDKDAVKGLLRISMDNLEEGRSIEISSAQFAAVRDTLKIGGNIYFVPVDGVTTERTQPVKFSSPQTDLATSVQLKPVRHLDIYLLSHTHNDIGYTDLQPNVEKKQWHNLEEALRLIDRTKSYPPDSRYKWNMEILWPFESYLQHATEEQRSRVIAAIRDGSIGLNGLFVNPLTGLAAAPEMSHFTEYARRFTEEYSIPITTAAVSDVPGFTWGMVTMLAGSGIKYFASAPNNGDRIGYVIEQLGDKPFYWASQSGMEKVLFWVAGSSYSSFHEGTLSNLGPEKIMKLVRRIDQSGYPYGMYYLPYTLGDNGGPDSTLSDVVREWNEKYVTPHLVISTHQQMFERFEQQYGTTLPTLKGDLTPYWEDGAASTAYETAMNRHVVDDLTGSEAVWSISKPDSFPGGDYYNAWMEVVLWDEHTWGADKSITDPDDPGVIGQWNIKKGYVRKADSIAAFLRTALAGSDKIHRRKTAVDIFNTTSWPRTDVVLLSEELSSAGDRVTDQHGTRMPSQRLSTGDLAVLVSDVPPMSALRILVGTGKPISGHDMKFIGSDGLENKFFRLLLDERSGAIHSLVWKNGNAELVDTARGLLLNRYIYVPGTNPDSAQFLSDVSIRPKERGELVSSLVITGNAPGCNGYSCEVRMYSGIPRVDIINNIDKRGIRSQEGVHIAFPFEVSGGKARYDVADAIVDPEKDQLPGSCRNFFSVASWVDVSNEQMGVTLSTPDAPLIEIGSITAESPWLKTLTPSQTIYSYVMNNYWHTNYKADQSGPVQFRYSILPHTSYDPLEAVKFGIDQRQPLIALVAEAAHPPSSSLFSLNPTDLVVQSVNPLGGGKSWLISFYNPEAFDAHATLKWRGGRNVKISASDLFGRPGPVLDRKLTLPAYGTKIVRVDLNE